MGGKVILCSVLPSTLYRMSTWSQNVTHQLKKHTCLFQFRYSCAVLTTKWQIFLWNTFVKKGDAVLCDICHGLQAQMEIQRDVCGASHLEFYSSTLFYSRVFALLSIKTIHLFVCLFVYLLIITGYTKTLKECLRDPELLSWRRNTGSPVYLL